MPRPARTSREQIVSAALALVDEQGSDALSMRAVAGRLGVDPMALYRHVEDKADLLGGMCDAVLEELPQPDPGAPWREQVHAVAAGLRDTLAARPALVPVLAGAPITPPAVELGRSLLAAVRGAGVRDEDASALLGAVFAHTLGAALVHALEPDSPDRTDLSDSDEALRVFVEADDPREQIDLLLDGVERRATSR